MAMASFSSAAKHLLLVVLIFALFLSGELEARDSQFFSKVASSNSNSNSKANSEEIIPQDSQNAGYGLVSEEQGSDQKVDTSKTTSNYNYMTEQKEELEGTTDQGYPTTYNDKAYVTKPQGYTPNNNKYGKNDDEFISGSSLMDAQGHSTTYNFNNNNNNNAYDSKPDFDTTYDSTNNKNNAVNTYNYPQQQQQQEFSQEEKYAVLNYNNNDDNNNNNYNEGAQGQVMYTNNNNYNEGAQGQVNYNNNYNYNEGAQGQVNYNNNNNNNRYNGQQEGMSDTRFLENGRYHYSLNNNNNNKQTNQYSPSNNNYNYNSNFNSMEVGYQQNDQELDAFNP